MKLPVDVAFQATDRFGNFFNSSLIKALSTGPPIYDSVRRLNYCKKLAASNHVNYVDIGNPVRKEVWGRFLIRLGRKYVNVTRTTLYVP